MEVLMARLEKCLPPFKPVPPSIITARVGLGQSNKKNEVLLVQQLLNSVAPGDGGPDPKLVEDGIVGSKTNAAIVKFQKKIMGGFADGRVDPSGKTINALRDKVTKTAEVGKIGLKSSFPEDRLGGGAVPLALGQLKLLQPNLLSLSFRLSRGSNSVKALAAKHFTNPGETDNDMDRLATILRDIRVFIDRANAFGNIQAANVILFFDQPGLLGFTVRGGDKMTTDDMQIYTESDGTARNYPGQSIFITNAWKNTSLPEQQLTLIHEFCHFVGDRDDPPPPLPPNPNKIDDHAYLDNPLMSHLNKDAKLRNAESLALFFLEFCIGTHPVLSIKPNANEFLINRPPIVAVGGLDVQV
jgi:hypothetical protein